MGGGSHAPAMWPHFQQTEDSRPYSSTEAVGRFFFNFNLVLKELFGSNCGARPYPRYRIVMANWDREHLSSLGINVKLPLRRGFGRTQRIDNWWTEPIWMATALTLALVYTALRVLVWDGGIHYDDHKSLHQYFLLMYSTCYTLQILRMDEFCYVDSLDTIRFPGTCYYIRKCTTEPSSKIQQVV